MLRKGGKDAKNTVCLGKDCFWEKRPNTTSFLKNLSMLVMENVVSARFAQQGCWESILQT